MINPIRELCPGTCSSTESSPVYERGPGVMSIRTGTTQSCRRNRPGRTPLLQDRGVSTNLAASSSKLADPLHRTMPRGDRPGGDETATMVESRSIRAASGVSCRHAPCHPYAGPACVSRLGTGDHALPWRRLSRPVT